LLSDSEPSTRALLIRQEGTNVMIFKNIFAEKFREKIGAFDSKQS
jgi:hypothetical protein